MKIKHTLAALAAGISSALTVILILDDSLRELLQNIPHTYLVLMKGARLESLLQPASLSFAGIFLLLGILGSLPGAAILVSIANAGHLRLRAGNLHGESEQGDAEQGVGAGIAALGGVLGAVFFFLFILAELAMDK